MATDPKVWGIYSEKQEAWFFLNGKIYESLSFAAAEVQLNVLLLMEREQAVQMERVRQAQQAQARGIVHPGKLVGPDGQPLPQLPPGVLVDKPIEVPDNGWYVRSFLEWHENQPDSFKLAEDREEQARVDLRDAMAGQPAKDAG